MVLAALKICCAGKASTEFLSKISVPASRILRILTSIVSDFVWGVLPAQRGRELGGRYVKPVQDILVSTPCD